ncbi:lasso peptide biosynthesis PqqD family chaperone [Streptomyces sp. NPDC093085]|uniref:lasso peptide biosynthesis PqqD family chaperone n=1 Tax=Streptomyces sp. NPDC093085 TaxID=3155068 RepID=UPI0034150D51
MSFAFHSYVSCADTDGGMALLDERRGKYFNLNPTAALIVRSLLRGSAPEDAAAELAARYPELSAQQAEADVQAVLASLATARLVAS